MWAFPERFEGRYVRLEPLSLAHLPGFLEAYDPEVYRFLSRAPREATPEALRAHLEGLLAEPGRVNWAVYREDALAGRISVIAPEPEHAKLELGTMLFKPFWGSPVNKEAKYLLLRHAFEVLGAERVQFKVDLRNERSQRALEALGAVREGVLRKNRRLPDGTFRDDVVYSVLKEEWPGVKARLEARLYGALGNP
ncbi:ribosomal-protein-alanine acetyltransferase [Thermus thermophilus]|uniref:GNAT family N-acetyltransferase n=1 Tax=Thermus thermophilus TaxID=274 RepID=UPI00090C89A5|nr:GNAT family protein [Thermus thermophilus]BAW01820.1 ribosomal-protein-alanine acetyltransferase [Thermus thermophilus]BDB12414.1 alanine acetyltransferase [Thermus thermophilus]